MNHFYTIKLIASVEAVNDKDVCNPIMIFNVITLSCKTSIQEAMFWVDDALLEILESLNSPVYKITPSHIKIIGLSNTVAIGGVINYQSMDWILPENSRLGRREIKNKINKNMLLASELLLNFNYFNASSLINYADILSLSLVDSDLLYGLFGDDF